MYPLRENLPPAPSNYQELSNTFPRTTSTSSVSLLCQHPFSLLTNISRHCSQAHADGEGTGIFCPFVWSREFFANEKCTLKDPLFNESKDLIDHIRTNKHHKNQLCCWTNAQINRWFEGARTKFSPTWMAANVSAAYADYDISVANHILHRHEEVMAQKQRLAGLNEQEKHTQEWTQKNKQARKKTQREDSEDNYEECGNDLIIKTPDKATIQRPETLFLKPERTDFSYGSLLPDEDIHMLKQQQYSKAIPTTPVVEPLGDFSTGLYERVEGLRQRLSLGITPPPPSKNISDNGTNSFVEVCLPTNLETDS